MTGLVGPVVPDVFLVHDRAHGELSREHSKMAAYSFLDLACDVLKGAARPLTYQEIWDAATEKRLVRKLHTTGKTPWQTLGAQLYVEVLRDNEDSRFVKVGSRPARFFLRDRKAELPDDAAARIEKEESTQAGKQPAYHERALHPLLTYFVFANSTFNRGRAIVTKTILHESSRKSGYNEWIHPDMVGFYLPLADWRPNVIEFNRVCDNNAVRLFSFEIKKSLNKANYRESFFQAVSNSSWAHEGYLVAAEILRDDDFLSELDRLASSFGIGIIHIDPADIDSSTILYPARARSMLDWETINKLCQQNKDFDKFLQDVRIDFESKRIHKSEFDEVKTDIRGYIREHLKIATEA